MFFRKDAAGTPAVRHNGNPITFDSPVAVALKMRGCDDYVPYDNSRGVGSRTRAVRALLKADQCPRFFNAEPVQWTPLTAVRYTMLMRDVLPVIPTIPIDAREFWQSLLLANSAQQ